MSAYIDNVIEEAFTNGKKSVRDRYYEVISAKPVDTHCIQRNYIMLSNVVDDVINTNSVCEKTLDI